MRNACPTVTGLLGLVFMLALAPSACRDAPAADGEAVPPAAAEASTARPDTRGWPRIRTILVADLTPPTERPIDLSLEADTAVRKALRADGLFSPAAEDDVGACAGEFEVGYALMVNGEVVREASSGEAHMALDGVVHCPDPDTEGSDAESFRVTVEADRAFGPEHELDAPAALRAMLSELAGHAAQRVFGQIGVRHADDARVLAILATEKRPGLLMEAASEAGERRLTGAVDDLVRLAAHEDPVVSLRAGAALGLIRDSRPEVLRALARMTEGSDVERHLIAINALGDIGTHEAARYLDTLAVGHPMSPMRDAARAAARRARAAAEGGDKAP